MEPPTPGPAEIIYSSNEPSSSRRAQVEQPWQGRSCYYHDGSFGIMDTRQPVYNHFENVHLLGRRPATPFEPIRRVVTTSRRIRDDNDVEVEMPRRTRHETPYYPGESRRSARRPSRHNWDRGTRIIARSGPNEYIMVRRPKRGGASPEKF